jgi:hypothetical protein
VGADRPRPRITVFDKWEQEKMSRTCLACGRRPAATTEEWPALCEPCLDRSGERIEPGIDVVCTVSDGRGGTVERLENDGFLAVVRTDDGGEAWVPVCELVRVTGRKSAATTT